MPPDVGTTSMGGRASSGCSERAASEDYRSFCDSYGACIVHDFLYISHPASTELNTLKMFARNFDLLHDLRNSDDPLDRITRPLMDEGPEGMLMWGTC